MKVLIVANHNTGYFVPFIIEQVNALKQLGVEFEFFGVHGKGIRGYLSNLSALKAKIREYHPDLIHAHYGLSGLLANLQRLVPVVTTYHGSDIHSGGWQLKLSQIAMHLSAYNIFVSKDLFEQSGYKRGNACIQSCGVNLDVVREIPRNEAREKLGQDIQQRFGLFSGRFDNQIKNYPLAKAAIEKLSDVQLKELKGYSREEVTLLMNACDFQLTTSFRESGPLVVKEAMACGTPVVTVDVGDVKYVMGDIKGCFIAERNADDIAHKIEQALVFQGKTEGRKRIIDLGLDNNIIAKKILSVYHVVNKK